MARNYGNLDLTPDEMLDYIMTGTSISLCSQSPVTRTEAVTTYMIATVTVTPGDGNDFDIDDDTSGRKVTTVEQADVEIINTGTPTHVTITDATNILFTTTCTSAEISDGGTVTIGSFVINVQDPIAP